MIARRRIGTAIASGLVTEIVNKIVPFVVLHLAMKRLGIEAFGYGQYILALVDFTNLAVILGYQNYAAVALARFAGDREKMAAAISTFLLVKILHAFAVCLLLLSPLVSLPDGSMWILIIGVISSSLDLSPLMMVEKKLIHLNHASIIGKAVNLTGIWWLVHSADDANLVPLFAVIANSVVSCYSLIASARAYPLGRTSFTHLRDFMIRSLPFLAPIGLFLALDRIDILILERQFGLAEMGRYSASLRLVQSAMPFVIMISNVFYSEVLGQTSNEADKKHFSLAFEAVTLMTTCLAAGIYLFADVAYALVYGAADPDAIAVLQILSSTVVSHGLYLVCVQQVLYVKGLTRIVSISLALGIAFIVLAFYLQWIEDIRSMAYISLAARFFCTAIVLAFAMRELKLFPNVQLRRVLIFGGILNILVHWAWPLAWHVRLGCFVLFVGPWLLMRFRHLLSRNKN